MVRSTNSERGAAHVLLVVLVVMVIAVAGLAIYNVNKSHNSAKMSASQSSPTPAPSASPLSLASCSVANSSSTPSGWKTASSGMAKFTFEYPSTWSCKPGVNNGGAETINVTSPNDFEIEFISATSQSQYGAESLAQNPNGTCSGCIVNSSQTFGAHAYGTLLLDAVTTGSQDGTANQLLLETQNHSLDIVSPTESDVTTSVWAIFQGRTPLQDAQMTYIQFASSADVNTAEQILKTLAY